MDDQSTLSYESFRAAMSLIEPEPAPLPMKIITSSQLTVPVLKRMCKSKKRRIRKKWLANPRNYKQVPSKDMYMVGDLVICHPSVRAAFEESLNSRFERALFSGNGLMGMGQWAA